MFFTNVVPKQTRSIPWGWQNETRDCDTLGLPRKLTFVSKPLGRIKMPLNLSSYFDWSQWTVEGFSPVKRFGTQNFKSIFTTAARFLGYEELLATMPALHTITQGFLEWNRTLLSHMGKHLHIFMIGDDIAGNDGLFMSPGDFETWLLPEYVELLSPARERGLEPAFHSDGDILDILPLLASVGFKHLSYQPVGRMAELASARQILGMLLYPVEDQARENEETLRLQRGVMK